MRMTVGQLRRIIRETVEEEMMRRDLNEGFLDTIKDFFGGKKASSSQVWEAMGNWSGQLPYGFEDFKDIFEEFQYSRDYDQGFVWNRLREAVGRFLADVSKGKTKAKNEQSLKNMAKYIEQGKNEFISSALSSFVRANAEEIKKVLFQGSWFKEAHEEVTGKSREAEEKIAKEKRNKELEKERGESEERWKIYGQERRKEVEDRAKGPRSYGDGERWD